MFEKQICRFMQNKDELVDSCRFDDVVPNRTYPFNSIEGKNIKYRIGKTRNPNKLKNLTFVPKDKIEAFQIVGYMEAHGDFAKDPSKPLTPDRFFVTIDQMSESTTEILELLKRIDIGIPELGIPPRHLHYGYGLKQKLSQQFDNDESGYGKIGFDRISGEIKSENCDAQPDLRNAAITLSTFMTIDSYVYFTGTGDNFYELAEEFMVERCVGFEEPEKMNNNGECVLCKADTEKLLVIVPCGHRCLCQSCADDANIRKCPICRVKTAKYLKQVNKPKFSLVERGDLMPNEQEFSFFDKGTAFSANYDDESDAEESDWSSTWP